MNDNFASRLRFAMDDKSMKLSKLSNITGISKPLISNYLSGNYEAKQQNLYKLAKALDVEPTWLMGLDVPMKKSNFSDNTSKFYFSLTLFEMIRYKRMKLKDFSKFLGINSERILDFINKNEIPTDKEIEKICSLFEIKAKDNLFNGQAYDYFVDKNNGSLGIAIIKRQLGKTEYNNMQNILAVEQFLPKEINYECKSIEDSNKNRLILQELLLKEKFLIDGERATDTQLESIEKYLNENIEYLNSILTDEKRKKYKLNNNA